MVTVVDAVSLLRDYGSTAFLRDRGESAGEEDARTLVDLLVEQIEFADVVVLNKAGDVGADQLALVRSVIRGLNADARIVEASHGRVPLDRVLDTGLFSEERAQEHPLWFKELYGAADHVPETEEYGIGSFVLPGSPSLRARGLRCLHQGDMAGPHPREGAFLAGDAPGLGR